MKLILTYRNLKFQQARWKTKVLFRINYYLSKAIYMMTQNNCCRGDDASNIDQQLSLTVMYQDNKDYLFHKSFGQQPLSAGDCIIDNFILLKTTICFEVSDIYFQNLIGILDSNCSAYKI